MHTLIQTLILLSVGYPGGGGRGDGPQLMTLITLMITLLTLIILIQCWISWRWRSGRWAIGSCVWTAALRYFQLEHTHTHTHTHALTHSHSLTHALTHSLIQNFY
jgi:hypothetical protein